MDPGILIKLREESLQTVLCISDMSFHRTDLIITDMDEGFWDLVINNHGYCFINRTDIYPYKQYCYMAVNGEYLEMFIKDPVSEDVWYDEKMKISSDKRFKFEVGQFLETVTSCYVDIMFNAGNDAGE